MNISRAGLCLAGFIIILFTGNLMVANAQYSVTGHILDVDNYYRDVVVELKSGNNIKNIALTTEGRFYTTLDWDNVYYFAFKKPGYVTKIIEFSTVLPKDKPRGTISPYHLPVSLFKTFENVDTIFFINPVAKIKYEKQLDDFADDRDYSLKVKFKIDEMRQKSVSNSKNREMVQDKNVSPNKGDNPSERIVKSKTKDLIAIKKPLEEENIIPPLKHTYPLGETVEVFELTGREVNRIVFNINGQYMVFQSVKHDWGGQFFFIEEADLVYRCISKETYLLMIKECRIKISFNK